MARFIEFSKDLNTSNFSALLKEYYTIDDSEDLLNDMITILNED